MEHRQVSLFIGISGERMWKLDAYIKFQYLTDWEPWYTIVLKLYISVVAVALYCLKKSRIINIMAYEDPRNICI